MIFGNAYIFWKKNMVSCDHSQQNPPQPPSCVGRRVSTIRMLLRLTLPLDVHQAFGEKKPALNGSLDGLKGT